jgi:hypothetical protein
VAAIFDTLFATSIKNNAPDPRRSGRLRRNSSRCPVAIHTGTFAHAAGGVTTGQREELRSLMV